MKLLPAFTTAPAVNRVYKPPYYGIIKLYRNTGDMMPDNKGRIQKGERLSKVTEFKKGEHWREPKPYWNREWLYREYVEKQRSSGDIATEFGVRDANILYFLKKFDIERRDVSEARAIKYWGVTGEDNPMYGRSAETNPNWRGGVSPERQTLYSSQEWSDAVKVVWKRDKATCQRCGVKSKDTDEMHIHHIVSFAVTHLRVEPSNLMLVCKTCHNWIHSKKNVNHEFLRDEA